MAGGVVSSGGDSHGTCQVGCGRLFSLSDFLRGKWKERAVRVN